MADPPAYLKWSREQEPVFYSPELDYWVVTRYEDIKAVFRDVARFSPANALEKITPSNEAVQRVLASYGYAMNRTLVNEDEPAHTARRRLLIEPFTPDAVRVHEPMVRQLTRRYVDQFINSGRADLVDQLLWEVPLTIALHFLGVEEDDMPLLRRYSIAHTVNTWGRPDADEQIRVAHAVGNFWRYSGEILDKMRANPEAPGWMQFGIRMQREHPDVVTDSYLHSMMMAGLVAAHETTANASANAMRLLLQHPDAWSQICADPSLIPNAVEECLRFSGSIIAWRRIALSEVTVGGITLPAGSKIMLVMTSGNHDDAYFNDADLLDIHRENAADHLSFGYGSHQCMGKNLARMEMQIFIEELSRRLPHMRLAAQEFEYLKNMSFRGPEHLWVEWEPLDNPERTSPECLTQHQTLSIGRAAPAAQTRELRVQHRIQHSERIIELVLESANGRLLPRWQAGAHIDIECGDTGLTRPYSLCGDPDNPHQLRVAVLLEDASRGGSSWIHHTLKRGDVIRARGPRNHFRLDERAPSVLLIAGGIGITPIMSMARRCKQLGLPYQLHYSGRSVTEMAFIDELEAAHETNLHLHVSDQGQRADYAAILAATDPATVVHVCGPANLINHIERLTAQWPGQRVRLERFQAQAALDPSQERAFEVVLKDSGLTLQVPADGTLLEALRSANIDVPSDCCEGLCGSCEVRVLDGEVDHRDIVLTREERQQHARMMSCCSRAMGKQLVLEL